MSDLIQAGRGLRCPNLSQSKTFRTGQHAPSGSSETCMNSLAFALLHAGYLLDSIKTITQ